MFGILIGLLGLVESFVGVCGSVANSVGVKEDSGWRLQTSV